jgi:hypothetical protein
LPKIILDFKTATLTPPIGGLIINRKAYHFRMLLMLSGHSGIEVRALL